MNFVKTISANLDKLNRRVVKFLRMGKSDFQTSLQIAPHGFESNPVKDMVAVYAETGEKGKTIIVGYLNKNVVTGIGESRVFSTDADGALKAYVWLRSDGTIRLNGDADFLMRFTKTKEVIEEIRDDINNLKEVFNNWMPVPNDGGLALKNGSAVWAAANFVKDIDAAKIETLKTP